MILVDTSVWIELLSERRRGAVSDQDLLQFATCAPVLQELLQGLRPGAASDAFRESILALPVLSDPIPLALYLQAAEIYREGRRRGLTIRSSVDCLIAAIAIHHSIPVWHRDRDFDKISHYTPLLTVDRR
jgi:predicted nucleic acid-binding protein